MICKVSFAQGVAAGQLNNAIPVTETKPGRGFHANHIGDAVSLWHL